ncbi:RES family NAD+ phosphorylase [Sphingomonas sanguinis]|uniref:RES family NAD+ phosphorylase n=1 Tax=Sphingomonas sanguinis TaxID=33051 RepID=A0ABU5LSR9_9SPHN|nr:RES family NAD+ phosphorylase [Sphingomonas sanguinis]MDZ7282984.1 RES family NAD+ phosphorylase [Sphingomonas sanguinis]
MTYPLRALSCPLWRMLTIRYQRDPLSGEGARRHGGRWNPPGQAALYLGTDHATAIAEFYQGLAKPGTLAPYRLEATAVADLTDGQDGPADDTVAQAMVAPWKHIAEIEGGIPDRDGRGGRPGPLRAESGRNGVSPVALAPGRRGRGGGGAGIA